MSVIDEYMLRFSPETQQRLALIRQIAWNVFQNVEERSCHNLPAIFANGRYIMFYGAYKNHISICVGYDWVDFLKCQYPGFQYTKATVIFPHAEPFPEDVVQVICELLNQGGGNGQ